MFLHPLAGIAEIKTSEEFRLYVGDDDRLRFRRYMQNQGIDFSRPVIAVAHTARLKYKEWPERYMKEILRRLLERYDIQIILNFADDAEYRCALQYQKELDYDSNIFVNIKAGSLTDLCALIVNCDFFFGNEGGPRHIAQALGVPAYAIYPPGIHKSLWLPDEGLRFSGISSDDFMPESEQNGRCMDYDARMRLIDIESVWNGLCTALRNNVTDLRGAK